MKKILVIEDNPSFSPILKHQLSDRDLRIDEARDWQQALEMCRTTAYVLVVADINIAVMRRALAPLQLLRLRFPNLPVLVLSAFSTPENVATALRSGATDFLEKPYDPDTLRERVAGCLRRHPQKRPTDKSTRDTGRIRRSWFSRYARR